MKHRKKMPVRTDKKMFNVTARKTKSINLSQKPMRGGVRLERRKNMVHEYYGIYDRVAKCYCYIGENNSDETFARMCKIMEKDEKTFLGQSPEDYKAYSYRD